MSIKLNENDQVILIDWGLFLHRSIFAWESMRLQRDKQIAETGNSDMLVLPATYTCLSMLIGCLKIVGVQPDDLVIVCMDGRGNWRRDVDPQYKANRKDLRADSEIDWKYWYKQFDELAEKLKKSTPFQYIRIDKLEADDIISVASRYYKDHTCVIISSDSDFEQLVAFENVRLFSPVSKDYKYIKNPYAILAKKLKKETTDNLLSPILEDADFERRKKLVNLLELPKEVENQVLDKISNFVYNDYDLSSFPFRTMIDRFMEIYNSKDVLSFEKSIQKKIQKLTKKAKPKKSPVKKGKKNVQNNLEIN